MKRHSLSIGLLFLALLPSIASAQAGVGGPTSAACLQDLYRAFGREHRLARAVLYGQSAPDVAPVASVLYDTEGNAWVKTAEDEWKSPGRPDAETLGNGDMEEKRESDLLCENNEDDAEASCVTLPRRGIFEIRKTPTSDLIHPIVQSIRALQCRLRAVCDVASASVGKAENEHVTITVDGCMPMTYPVLEGCREVSQNLFETIPGSCQSARRELVRREMQLLTVAVSYDASYRATAQFAGMFQEFLVQFRFPLIEPLWQAVRMLGELKDIPCFQASCNE